MADVAVIGGGLAGLTAAIDLTKRGVKVVLLEKKSYPFHRVCGEYISNETLPYLRQLDIYPDALQPAQINHFHLSSPSGKLVQAPLDLGGFGVSRYDFDSFLADKAKEAGAQILEKTAVTEIDFSEDGFELATTQGSVSAKAVIGAFGKRSTLDRQLERPFFSKPSPFVGIKWHMKIDFPEDVIALHNFRGGYCGVVKINGDSIYNVCYLVQRKWLKRAGDIPALEKDVLSKNPFLGEIFGSGEKMTEKPEVINEISFETKAPVEQHILMAGDAAGMIAPLCGNGMAMAIHSGKIAAEAASDFLHHGNRQQMEWEYQTGWNQQFKNRLRNGRLIQKLFGNNWISETAVSTAKAFPSVLDKILPLTHGKKF